MSIEKQFDQVFLQESSNVIPASWITAFREESAESFPRTRDSGISISDDDMIRGPLGLLKSKSLTLLAERLIKIETVPQPGRIVWFNKELATRTGMEHLNGDLGHPSYEATLLKHFSRRVKTAADSVDPDGPGYLYADLYTGLEGNYGAGRAAFSEWGDLYLKGIGKTPLVGNSSSRNLSNGFLTLREAIIEAAFGEVCDQLFSCGAARILLIILVEEPNRGIRGLLREPKAIVVRHGTHLRLAHFLDYSDYRRHLESLHQLIGKIVGERAWAQVLDRISSEGNDGVGSDFKDRLPVFLSALKALDLDSTTPTDLREQFRILIDRHAKTSAEQFRWRFVHGGASESNSTLDGSLIDFMSCSTQPRTTQYRIAPTNMAFVEEGWRRPFALKMLYDSLAIEDASSSFEDQESGFDLHGEYVVAYELHLQKLVLDTAGLSGDIGRLAFQANPKCVQRFASIVTQLADLQNGSENLDISALCRPKSKIVMIIKGLAQIIFSAWKGNFRSGPVYESGIDPVGLRKACIEGSAVDVFRLLGDYPRHYFNQPEVDVVTQKALVTLLLAPVVYRSETMPSIEEQIDRLSEEFYKTFDELINSLKSEVLKSTTVDWEVTKNSIVAQAEKTKRPLRALFFWNLYPNVVRCIISKNKRRAIEDFISATVSESV